MTTLIRFVDTQKACNAVIEMSTGDLCYVNVVKTGVAVTKWLAFFGPPLHKEKDVHVLLSKLQTLRQLAGVVVTKGFTFFGAGLYKEKDVHALLSKLQDLRMLGLDDITPAKMQSRALKVIVNTILHCEDLEIVAETLNDPKSVSLQPAV